MFIGHRVEVRHLLCPTNNKLEITFESAYEKSESLRAERGHLLCWNGHYGRVYVRKAQHHFGWDWGPSFVTCGPWKPICLERYLCRVADVKVDIDVSSDLAEAALTVNIATEPSVLPSYAFLEVQLTDPDGTVLDARKIEADSQPTRFQLSRPRLWYPHTHGEQPLYQVKASVRSDEDGDAVLDNKTQTIGIRRIELIQSPLKEGSTFYFTCNGIPMFMGGSNWIPGDTFLPRVTPAKYKRWIDMAVRGNQNMLRVWGGGIYEADAFYDECDRRGIFVWQDFCFACGQYPSDKAFVDSVKEEATQAIKRLRSHPSLIIWAGNNEDYQIANEGLKHDMTLPPEEWPNSTFGARTTYEKVLPELVEEHSPGTIYWPGSPFGGVDNNSDRTIGDVHIWNVSSGMLLPYQRYPDVTGRFVSEFGMLSCPSVETIKESFLGDSGDAHPQSRAFEFHCKASSYEKRMFTCMGENFRLAFDTETYVYLTQLLQSEAMYYAYRGWRRQFEGRECGGALVWQVSTDLLQILLEDVLGTNGHYQTNDSWPAVSWAIIDYYERPKMAYYAICRALKPVATGVSRRMKTNPRPNLQHEAFCNGKTKADAASVIAHATPHIYPSRESTYSVWVANSTTDVQKITVRVRFISVKTGREVSDPIRRTVEAKATGTTEVISGPTPEEEPTVVVSEVFDPEGNLISHDVDWTQPLKHLTFPERHLNVHVEGESVVVSVDKPVKGLFFTNDRVEWGDNGLDIVPGQKLKIKAKGLRDDPEWMYYGM
jgi:beta-mannosidase